MDQIAENIEDDFNGIEKEFNSILNEILGT